MGQNYGNLKEVLWHSLLEHASKIQESNPPKYLEKGEACNKSRETCEDSQLEDLMNPFIQKCQADLWV